MLLDDEMNAVADVEEGVVDARVGRGQSARDVLYSFLEASSAFTGITPRQIWDA